MRTANWYKRDGDDGCLDPARDVFQEAVEIFKSKLTNDERKRNQIEQACCLEDVMKSVQEAQEKYAEKSKSKAHEQLVKLSSRISYYGNVMDVLASHHPEYVALAWGAMKLVLTAVINHDKMISSLAKGLSKIAESLPHVELAAVLYPTKKMERAVAELYANIIRFLIRAQHWYQEGKLLHALHSVTRPVELRYKDLIEDIQQCSMNIDKLALSGSQAEQRDMHSEIIALRAGQAELKQLVITFQTVNSTLHINTNQRLSDLQLSNILTSTANIPLLDPIKSLQFNLSMRNTRRSKRSSTTESFWMHPKLQNWEERDTSSLVVVKGAYKRRNDVKDFCVDVIEYLQRAKVPVVWALKTTNQEGPEAPSTLDLLKHLTSQILKLNTALHTERSMSLSCAKFQTATDEDEWFEILASVMVGLTRLYIIVDIETLGTLFAGEVSLPVAFLQFLNKRLGRTCKTIVKVALVSYGSCVASGTPGGNLSDMTLMVGRPKGGKTSNSKGGKKGKRQKEFALGSREYRNRIEVQ